MSNGKGDRTRKMSITRKEWDKKYDKIFNEKQTKKKRKE